MNLDRGFWAGMTLYPVTKCTPERAVDMIEAYGGVPRLACAYGEALPVASNDLENSTYQSQYSFHMNSYKA